MCSSSDIYDIRGGIYTIGFNCKMQAWMYLENHRKGVFFISKGSFEPLRTLFLKNRFRQEKTLIKTRQ